MMRLQKACIFIFMLVLLPAHLLAAPWEGKTVKEIKVVGNKNVETATVLAQLRSEIGKPLDPRVIREDIKRLFATGFFSDIRAYIEPSAEGVSLLYEVVENPFIAGVEIEGNDEIPDKKLMPKLNLQPGRVFNPTVLAKDVETIRKAYLKKGYYQVRVEVQEKKLADGRLRVTFLVHEGHVTRIKRIRFVGNASFSSKELKRVIASRESGLAAWITDRDIFRASRLNADRGMLEQFYMDEGYLDARVESVAVTMSPDKRWFYLTFNIHEGPRYKIGQVDIQGDLVPSKEALQAEIKLQKGEWYSLKRLRESIQAMNEKVGDEGYAFATITPLFKRHMDARTVDITFDIEKGREVYITRIEIAGNEKTEDRVIRRELRQSEGERFGATKLATSKKRLQRTDLFEDVRISTPKEQAPDQVRMKVEVQEKKTGSFALGFGFSQLEKTFFTAKIEERNFLGKGITTNVNGEVGAKTQNFDVSVTDPYFLDQPLSLSINAFKQQTRLQDFTSFKQNNFGLGTSLGIPLSEEWTYSIGYQFTKTHIFDLPAGASLVLQSQAGKQSTGEVTQVLTWDTRNAMLTPSSGHLEQLRFGVAGLGGTNRFIETQALMRQYFSLSDRWILSPGLQGKYIRGYRGRNVPIYRRYSLGGSGSLRGFDYFGVTIRDPATGDVIGGNKEVTGSLDLYFPLPFMETPGFRGDIFLDAGTVADFNRRLRFADLRVSSGFALQWVSPLGPLSLVWGYPLRSRPGDVKRVFEFAIGAGF